MGWRMRTMKMGWRMRRERMISGLTTYIFLFLSFIFCVLQFYLNEMFVDLRDVGVSSEVAE